MAALTPDVRAFVAAALAAGHKPAEIESAVRAELLKQVAPYWVRNPNRYGDGWHLVEVCRACGVEYLERCPRPVPHCGGTTRQTIPLREYETGETAAAVMPLPQPEPVVQLRLA